MQQRIAPDRWARANVAACNRPQLADTTGWVRATAAGRTFGFTLPSEFVADPTFRSHHGGFAWKNSQQKFAVEWGHWGVYPSGEFLEACEIEVEAGTFIIQQTVEDGLHVLWAIRTDNEWNPTEMVNGRSAELEDLRVMWTAIVTAVTIP